MSDRHAEFSSAEPDGYREAATLVVSKLAALIPLKDTIAATKNGQTFVDYFSAALSAYDKQRALIETLVKALEESAQRNVYDGDYFHDIGLSDRMRASWNAEKQARAALAAAKEQSA